MEPHFKTRHISIQKSGNKFFLRDPATGQKVEIVSPGTKGVAIALKSGWGEI